MKVLEEKPESKLPANFQLAGQNMDVNFFMHKIKEYDFDEAKQVFAESENLQKEFKESSKRMAVLQILDSMLSIPDTYEKTILEANQELDKENFTPFSSKHLFMQETQSAFALSF